MSTSILTLVFLFQVHAIEVRPIYEVNDSGTISKKTIMSCSDSDESICKNECNMSTCQYEEPTCINCAGSSSELLQVLFSKVTKFYKRVSQSNEASNTLLELIKDKRLVILDSQSLFNFYTNISENESLIEFKKLCPMGTYQAMIALKLDEYGFPEKPVASICETIDRKQSYFNLVNIESSSDLNEQKTLLDELPIKLRFEYQLK